MSKVDESFEDWTLESRLSLRTSDDSTGLVEMDLVEAPLTGGEEPTHRIRLTRDAAVWLRDTLTDALGKAER